MGLHPWDLFRFSFVLVAFAIVVMIIGGGISHFASRHNHPVRDRVYADVWLLAVPFYLLGAAFGIGAVIYFAIGLILLVRGG
jgi:hypothetical protein